MSFNTNETDRLLSTTRSVKKRLDLEREVSEEVLLDCIEIAEQAPTGGGGGGPGGARAGALLRRRR